MDSRRQMPTWTPPRHAQNDCAPAFSVKRSPSRTPRQNSDDVTRASQGRLGALPRTLLKREMETALLASTPGDITPPIRINNGCAIARLDKRGQDLTLEEREQAIKLYKNYKKREEEVLARMFKNVQWTNTLGQPPRLNASLANRP